MIRCILPAAMLVAMTYAVIEYRTDYEYNPKAKAFYKLHTESAFFRDAKFTCEVENAKLILAVPEDIIQAHAMLKQFPDIGQFIWAGDDGLTHESGEINEDYVDDFRNGISHLYNDIHCEAIKRNGEVRKLSCFDKFSFICKVEEKDIIRDPRCNVFSKGYQYIENVGSCYKIYNIGVSWNQAYAECQAEGAHLLILNSELEHQAVHNLTRSAPRPSNTAITEWILAGIRANRTQDNSPLVFKTIFGQTLTEAGFDQWSEGEPNNWHNSEFCGSISRSDGKYNDITCYHLVAYICEKEINTKP